MATNNGETLTSIMRILDPGGLHTRPCATIAGRLRSLPGTRVILHAPDGRRASARNPLALLSLNVEYGEELTAEAKGPFAAEALDAIREAVGGPAPHREQVQRNFPEQYARLEDPERGDGSGVLGDSLGWSVRVWKQRRLRRLQKQDEADLQAWKAPGGWLFEWLDDRTPETKLQEAEEELSLNPHDEESQRRAEEARRELEEWREACRRNREEGRGLGGKP